MKVKELIEQLNQQNPEAEVILTSSNFEHNGAKKSLGSIHAYNAELREQRFRDAFDGESYGSSVWMIDRGNTPVVLLY